MLVRMSSSTSAGGAPPRRVDRRAQILDAAFAVFARKGYANAGIREIAEEAGVSAPTVYNHFEDKATLFRKAIERAGQVATAETVAAIDLLRSADDLAATLEEVGLALLRSYAGEPATSLRGLLQAEASRFPDLIEVHRKGVGRIGDTLADRLARLTVEGRLRLTDPAPAAEQLLALLVGPVDIRSELGTRRVSDDELRAISHEAVNTFLNAYGAGD
jgi:TetR/AcrR family transcriptional regulator, mexJK operon transcriptional repressor